MHPKALSGATRGLRRLQESFQRTLKPSKGFSKGSKGLQPLCKDLQCLFQAFERVSEAFEGTQRLSVEPPEGFGGFWRASRALGSLSRAFGRAPKAFNHSAKISNVFARHEKGFLRLLKAPKGSQWSCKRVWRLLESFQRARKPFKGFWKGSKGLQTLCKDLQCLLKAFERVSEVFEGTQRLSVEPPEGFRGFWTLEFPNTLRQTPTFFGLPAASAEETLVTILPARQINSSTITPKQRNHQRRVRENCYIYYYSYYYYYENRERFFSSLQEKTIFCEHF